MVFIEEINSKRYKECFDLDYETIRLWNKEHWQNELKKKEVKALGVLRNNKIIGILVGQLLLNEAEIIYLSVQPFFRRKGLGTKLIKQFFTICIKNEISRIILEVSSENSSAISFYSKFKFKTINTRKKYYRNGTNAIVKEKKLLKK